MKFFVRSRRLICLLLTMICAVSMLSVFASAQGSVIIEELTIFLSQSPVLGEAAEDCVVFSSAAGCGLTGYIWLDPDGQSISGSFDGKSTQLQVSFEALSGYRFSAETKVTLDSVPCDCRISEDGSSLTASTRFYFSDTGEASKHEHFYNNWEYDNRTHWQRCIECGQISAVSTHTMTWETASGSANHTDNLQKGICNVCGYSVYRGNEGGFSITKIGSHIGLYIFLFSLALLVILIVVFNLFSKLKHAIQRKKKAKARQLHHTHHHHHHHHHSETPTEATKEKAPENGGVTPTETKENDGAGS